MFVGLNIGNLIEPLSGRRWTAEQSRQQIRRRAERYSRLGVASGDRIFLHHGNCLEFFADLAALWTIGACVVPIDARLTSFEITALAGAAKPRMSLHIGIDAEVVKTLEAAGVRVAESGVGEAGEEQAGAQTGALKLDAAALILFTSGTTGNPKGVVHTHRSLRAKWTALRQSLGLERYRRTLCLLPTHFGHGLICNSLYPWLSGADLHIVPPFQPKTVMALGKILDEFEITFMSSVPSLWQLALRVAKPPERRTLERVFCGSAPLSAALWNGIREWTGASEVWNAYGITETGSWMAGSSYSDFTPEDGLIGEGWGSVLKVLRSDQTQPFPGIEAECAVGESGYVWIQTPALMQGYLDRDDLTNAVVSQGWFMTGDIGMIDERGRLFLRGRERDEINKGGMKVYPADIDAVFEAFDGVHDVCTFAYEGDPLYGENVGVAFVAPELSQAGLKQLYEAVTTKLGSHQVPARWYRVSEVPRTSRGKVNRRTVAEACAKLAPINWRDVMRDAE